MNAIPTRAHRMGQGRPADACLAGVCLADACVSENRNVTENRKGSTG